MGTLVDVLQLLQTAAFLLIALWALYRWHSRTDEASRWLAATFGSIGLVVGSSELLELLPATLPEAPVQGVLVGLLAAFPYLLLRFLDVFDRVRSTARRALGIVVLLLVATGFVVPFPEENEPRTAVFWAYALVLVATWTAVLFFVAWRFFSASRAQPTLARRRLRLLATATVALSLALLLAAFVPAPTDAVTVTTQGFALISAGLFLVGFAPPGPLRRLWRQPEELELHAAAVNLMATVTEQEVAEVLLPHLRRVVGARGVALVRDAEVLGSDGIDTGPGESPAPLGEFVTYELRAGTLHVWLDPYTPFFGDEELDLLGRLGLLADLALDRSALLASETRARNELEHANAELESFVYSASHDLKSPLIAMLGYVDLLVDEQDAELSEDARWYLQRMHTNGRYMEALIRDLLELSRVGRMQTAPERVELAAVAEDVATEVSRQYPAATVQVGALPVVWMNGIRARQLLANLIENAAKHADGPVTIVLGTQPSPEGGAVVTVTDDGPGIPAAYRDLVFGVFERLNPEDAHSGTGIGLAICRKIVETAGGRIWVDDRDEGTEFRLHFPDTVVLAPATTRQEVPA